ncbi:MAG: hypothetical protein AseanaTS_30450 [Candidatus Pelagadaptatus aseana]
MHIARGNNGRREDESRWRSFALAQDDTVVGLGELGYHGKMIDCLFSRMMRANFSLFDQDLQHG